MTENALLECVARGLEAGTKPPGPEELGVWICASAMPKATLKQVAIEFLARILPSEALDYVDSTQRSCTKYESTAFFASCFASMKTSHPEWLVLVGKSLNPELLFDLERGVTIVQVAHALSGVQGGEWAEYLLAEGGLGNFGGTSDQIDRSLTATLTLKASPSERLGYIEKVLNSINTPGGAGIGQTVMHFLFASTGECWPDGNSSAAILYANRLLDDDRFRKDASVQLLHEYSMDQPPRASVLDAEEWKALIARALRIESQD